MSESKGTGPHHKVVHGKHREVPKLLVWLGDLNALVTKTCLLSPTTPGNKHKTAVSKVTPAFQQQQALAGAFPSVPAHRAPTDAPNPEVCWWGYSRVIPVGSLKTLWRASPQELPQWDGHQAERLPYFWIWMSAAAAGEWSVLTLPPCCCHSIKYMLAGPLVTFTVPLQIH